MTNKPSSLGTRIRTLRLRYGLTQSALAQRAGISRSTVADLETGKRSSVTTTTLAALARAVGVTSDFLLTGE